MNHLQIIFGNKKFMRIAALEVIVVSTIASFFLSGGEDLHGYYIPLANGCLNCAFNPWYASWILFPLKFLPFRQAWTIWVLISFLLLLWTAHKLNTEPLAVFLAFPTLGMLWLGQVDAVIAVGIMLALVATNAYLRGLGLLLVSIKPQIALVVIPVILWHDRERFKLLVVPVLVMIASFAVWGIDWPLRWFAQRDPLAELPVWGSAALVPFGTLAFAGIFLVHEARDRVIVALTASALAFPWFGIYSYVVFLVLFAPWWSIPISYAWIAAYPLEGSRALHFAWILPLSFLLYVIWTRGRWRPGVKADGPLEPGTQTQRDELKSSPKSSIQPRLPPVRE